MSFKGKKRRDGKGRKKRKERKGWGNEWKEKEGKGREEKIGFI